MRTIIKLLYDTFKKLDLFVFIPFFILSIFGIVMVYSASSDIAIQNGGSPMGYLVKQTFFFILSLITIMFIFHANFLRSTKVIATFGMLIIIMLVYLFFFGKSVNGAAGWISVLGLFNIQPSEITKFYFIIFIANHVDHHQGAIVHHWMRGMMNIYVYSALVLILILIQPDIGGTAINAGIIFVMLLASGIRWQRAVGFAASIITILFLVFFCILVPVSKHSSIYALQRIVAFTDPFAYSHGIGQQLVNSYYALSNGGFFGVGLGNSIQKNGYLPEPNTDFIMSIIAEELGFFAIAIVMILLTFMVCRIIVIGIRSDDAYSALVCYGTATYLTIQMLFNVGGVTGLLPITGVTFPFISYGGSSMVTLSCCLGLVLRISYHQKLLRNRLINKEGL
ncbi:cell division protein FtsW [Philodulcilactobacillus myokoensis]|uniref:Probable peptidoglycan glycosyltransferase FtsW n=1 Tax=Philodulcilactobacillus myokoensis TaxID=2929573 RepID=A0A9W6B1U8_9LACO|nr:cell division protein FtsW [Philodulcilactobacillus myokoensis]